MSGAPIHTPVIAGALLVQCLRCKTEQLVEDRMVSLHVCDCGGRAFAYSDTAIIGGHHKGGNRTSPIGDVVRAWAA